MRLMVVVEYSANTPACTLGDFACALGGANADVLAGDACTFAHVANGVNRVKGDKIARTFPNTLGGRSSALGSSFADVTGALADIATGAALLGLPLGGGRRCVARLRRWLGLAVLAGGVLAPEDKCKCEQRNKRSWNSGSHG
jgi:hypothetical protein